MTSTTRTRRRTIRRGLAGSYRVVRGGGWVGPARFCRSAFRHCVRARDPRNILGFRASLVPADK